MIKRLKISLNVLLAIFLVLAISFVSTIAGINLYKNVYVYDNLVTEVRADNQNIDDNLFDVFFNVALYKNSIFSETNLNDFKTSANKADFLLDLEENNRLNSDLFYDVALVENNQYYSVKAPAFYLDSNAMKQLDGTDNQLFVLGKFSYQDDYSLVIGVKNAEIISLFYLKESALTSLFDLSYDHSFSVVTIKDQIVISTANEVLSLNVSNLDLTSAQIVIDEVRYLVMANPLLESSYFHPDLVNVTFISYATIYRDIDTIQTFTIILLLLFFVIVGVISYLMVKRIVKPINALSKKMMTIDFNQTQSETLPMTKENNEISILEKSYQDMIYRIQELMRQQQVDYETQRQLELDSLQMQVNPHFLYNSLDMIAWMSKLGNNKNIEEFVILLARFYRLSLHKGAKYIRVSEEIDIIKYYLDIQAKVFPDLFTYEIDCDPNIAEYLSLKLILQPFVENIIKYAFHGINQKGNIKIKAYADENYVIYEVIDNGVGFDVEILNQIDEKKNGFGIKNVKERLALEYNYQAKLTIESTLGKGTIVRVAIPKSF